MEEVKFYGKPDFKVKIGTGLYEIMSIRKYFKKLKKDNKKYKITKFEETENNFYYNLDYESYFINKKNLSDKILEELRKMKIIYDNKKIEREKHPVKTKLFKMFYEEKTNILENGTSLPPIIVTLIIALGSLFIVNTLLEFIIAAILCVLSFILTIPAIAFYRSIKEISGMKGIKQLIKEAFNKKYFKETVKIKTSKKHRVIYIQKKAKDKKNIKESIIEQINLVQELISKLSLETQKEYQKKLYDLLENYRKKIGEVRNQKQNLTLVYEFDIDTLFFQSLINLEAEINIKLTTSDLNRFAEYDKTIEDIEKELKERLLSSDDTPIARTRGKEEGQHLQI